MGGNHRKKGCCSYVEAGRSVARGQFRLAVRYVRMDVKARLGIISPTGRASTPDARHNHWRDGPCPQRN